MPVTKTLTDILNRNDRFDYNKIIFYTQTQNLIVLDTDLVALYMQYIKQFIGTYQISDYQRSYYRCRPHLLSTDVYGTPELDWLILMINDQESPSKFHLKSTVKLISPDNLSRVYDIILTRSSERLNENWNTYLTNIGVSEEDETPIWK